MTVTTETSKVQRATLSTTIPVTLADIRELFQATKRYADDSPVTFAVAGAWFQPDTIRVTYQVPETPAEPAEPAP